MVVVEFRIPMPLTVEEYNRAQLHSEPISCRMAAYASVAGGAVTQILLLLAVTAMKSLDATNAEKGGGGIEILINEPYDNTDGHWGKSPITGITVPRTRGQYTLKRYHLKSKFPAAVVASA